MKHVQKSIPGWPRASAVLAGLMLVTINGAKGAEKMTTAEFYVALSGQDTNPGTVAAPFATPARAREAVRGRIKEGLTKDIKRNSYYEKPSEQRRRKRRKSLKRAQQESAEL